MADLLNQELLFQLKMKDSFNPCLLRKMLLPLINKKSKEK